MADLGGCKCTPPPFGSDGRAWTSIATGDFSDLPKGAKYLSWQLLQTETKLVS